MILRLTRLCGDVCRFPRVIREKVAKKGGPPNKLASCPVVVIVIQYVGSEQPILHEHLPRCDRYFRAGHNRRYAAASGIHDTCSIVRTTNMEVRSGTIHTCLDTQPIVDPAAEGSAHGKLK